MKKCLVSIFVLYALLNFYLKNARILKTKVYRILFSYRKSGSCIKKD